jgi:ABC-type Zn2+ transport system substrate-binding protein/surface adhesin
MAKKKPASGGKVNRGIKPVAVDVGADDLRKCAAVIEALARDIRAVAADMDAIDLATIRPKPAKYLNSVDNLTIWIGEDLEGSVEKAAKKTATTAQATRIASRYAENNLRRKSS